MSWMVNVPIEARLVLAFVVGACLGALANWAAIRFAWEPRGVNPWIPGPSGFGKRSLDRIPIVGWLFFHNEANEATVAAASQEPLSDAVLTNEPEALAVGGEQAVVNEPPQRSQSCPAGVWIRPFLVELLSALGIAWLYWWEVDQGRVLPVAVPPAVLAELATMLHVQWLCHAVLAWLMLAASLIDADEKLIPDEITVSGTLFGLAVAALYPFALLPVAAQANIPLTFDFLQPFSPHAWPQWLDGRPHGVSLAIGLGLWWLWCVALMDRPLYLSWGWYRALGYLFARLARSPSTRRLCEIGLLGSAVIVGFWYRGGPNWTGLFTSLIGLAAGGGLIWMVRIIGAITLRREAMGFGDVILLAMIGTLLGWQSCVVIFFLAPVAGLVLGLLQLVLRRENEIPYGPFLCLATIILIVQWRPIWNWLEAILFVMGGLVPLFMVICLAAMAVLLGLWGLVRRAF